MNKQLKIKAPATGIVEAMNDDIMSNESFLCVYVAQHRRLKVLRCIEREKQ